MPIKRQASPAKAPAKSKPAVSRRSIRRAAAPAPVEEVHVATPRFLSADEKRQLILAHAQMRRPHDPIPMLSVWAGVAVTVMVLVVGYWYATKPSFVEAQSKPFDEELAPALQNIQVFTEKMKELPEVLSQRKQAVSLEKLEGEAKARQAALDALAGKLHDEQAGVRVDLFKP